MKKIFSHILATLIMLICFVSITHASGGGEIQATIPNPFANGIGNDLGTVLKNIIGLVVLPIGAVIAVLAFIWTGFMYVKAQGKPGEIEKANKSLLYTSVGTAILLGAWTIAELINGTVNQLK